MVMPFRILCNAFLVLRMRFVFVLEDVSNVKYCHTCGKHLSESTAKEESTQNEKGQSSGGDAEVIEATSGRMSFAQLKALKEED